MAFIKTVPPEEAEGKLKELYDGDLKGMGYVPNYTQAMSLRPEVIEAWRGFLKVVRSRMRLRRYELVTFAAATALKCSY